MIEPTVFRDQRGYFLESWNQADVDAALERHVQFVQDNRSFSCRSGVVRGLHYQLDPPQAKLVGAAHGRVFDVAVDIRRGSRSFGEWVSVELSDERGNLIWIPEGFAHGFMVLSPTAQVVYKTTAHYCASSDRSIAWDDEDIGIEWPDLGVDPLLSEKDRSAPRFVDAEVFGQ